MILAKDLDSPGSTENFQNVIWICSNTTKLLTNKGHVDKNRVWNQESNHYCRIDDERCWVALQSIHEEEAISQKHLQNSNQCRVVFT
jgi:hypothetical protein